MNPFNTDDFSTPGGAFVPFTPGYVGSPGWLYQFSSGFDVQGARDGGVFSATNTNNYASYVISRVPSTPSYTTGSRGNADFDVSGGGGGGWRLA